VIVGPHPVGGDALDVIQIVPVVLGEPLIANCPVEPLDIGVLLGLARLDIFEFDPPST